MYCRLLYKQSKSSRTGIVSFNVLYIEKGFNLRFAEQYIENKVFSRNPVTRLKFENVELTTPMIVGIRELALRGIFTELKYVDLSTLLRSKEELYDELCQILFMLRKNTLIIEKNVD